MKPFALVVVASALLLTGCTPIVALQPAEDATAVECASMVVALPDVVSGRFGDLAQRETNAQGTGAYGDPSTVVVRCGVESPAPTSTQLCIPVDGINWLRDDSMDPTLVFTTYGREPTVQVVLDNDNATPGNVLSDLTGAVSRTASVRECTNIVN
jgi:hypothetical protein